MPPALHPGQLTDVAGLQVGHWSDTRRPTGCSVVLCPQGAVAGVDVRGAAPGTRESDLLQPGTLVEQVHAVLLTGGSAFGLDAAGGVMRWLEQHGHGLAVGPARVPIVPGAVLFDLWLGDAAIRPDAAAGYAACAAAAASPAGAPLAQGSVGAGSGATVGKLYGMARAMRGGIGTASLRVGAVTVAALVAVNAMGDVLDHRSRRLLAGLRSADGGQLRRSLDAMLAGDLPEPLRAGLATTIGVIGTDAQLDKAQAQRLALMAHDGLARSIDPIHTLSDGDTLYALATGRSGRTPHLTVLGALAAEVTARAVANAVWQAESLRAPGLPELPCAHELAAAAAP